MTDTAGRPLVGIGLPVYNGQRYVERALESLLAQDYPHLEIVISDNASTDRTPEICQDYAAKYPQLKYFRAAKNSGASWNFNEVFRLSRGEYFMWAAHDDLWAKSCVSSCVDALARHPEAAVCHPSSQPVDHDGNRVGEPYITSEFVTEAPTVAGRWRDGLANPVLHAAIYGVIRRAALAQVRPLQVCNGADAVLIAELCLHGTIIQTAESLSSKRVPAPKEKYLSHAEMLAYLGGRPSHNRLVHTSIFVEMVRGLLHAPLDARTKADLLLVAVDTYLRAGIYLRDLKSNIIETVGMDRVRAMKGFFSR